MGGKVGGRIVLWSCVSIYIEGVCLVDILSVVLCVCFMSEEVAEMSWAVWQ